MLVSLFLANRLQGKQKMINDATCDHGLTGNGDWEYVQTFHLAVHIYHCWIVAYNRITYLL